MATTSNSTVPASASPAAAAAAAAAAPSATSPDREYDVLIIGGGPAGLAVASHCTAVGRSYLILEARARLGGRVMTNTELGVPVDIGASWIHHYGTSNPLAREAWNHRVLMGVPKGGAELWVPRGDCSSDCVQAADVLAGASAFGRMEAARTEFGEAHCAAVHRHSAFEHAEFEEYLGGMQYTPAETIALMDCDARAGSKQCGESDQSYAQFLKQFPVVQAALSSSAPATAAASGSSAVAATNESSAASSADSSLSPMAAGVLRSYLREESLYEGCSLERLSAAHSGEQLEGIPECDMQCGSGYGKLLGLIAKKARIDQHAVLDTVVTAVETRLDGVTVHARKLQPSERPLTAHGSSVHPVESPVPPPSSATSGAPVVYRGRYVVVTVPLGVLQRRAIRFTPPLPRWKDHAIDTMGYGVLNKVVLQFDTPFWEEQEPTQQTQQQEQAAPSESSVTASAGGKVNVINIIQSPEDAPLWIVNLSRPLHAAAARAKHLAATGATQLDDATYARTAAEYTPLALTFQEQEEEYIAGNIPDDDDEDESESSKKGKTVPASSAAAPAAAVVKATDSASSSVAPAAVPATAAAAPSTVAPMHVLVSFTSSFDESVPSDASARPWTASRTEAQPDSEIVGQLMRQLRRAFQGGVEGKATQAELDALSKTIHVSATTTDSSVAYAHPHPSVPGIVSSTPMPVPVAFRFTSPRFVSTPRAVRAVPDPVGYLVTRWGLEPFSHGAYAHYAKGAGPHTAALLGKAVAVRAVSVTATAATATTAQNGAALECVEDEEDAAPPVSGERWSDSITTAAHVVRPASIAASTAAAAASRTPTATRLLFAGEATLGVHLGCADSAWLSGLREAKRIQLLWAQQERRNSKA